MPAGTPVPPETLATIFRMRSHGIKIQAIAIRLGLPESTVSSIVTPNAPRRKKRETTQKEPAECRLPKQPEIFPPDMRRKPELCWKCKKPSKMPANLKAPCLACQIRKIMEDS